MLRGISVVETLVVAVLLGLLFYNIYHLLLPGMRVWMKSDRKVTLQQNALMALYRLKDELKETNQNSVSLRNYDPPYRGITTLVCFVSAVNDKGEVCSKKIIYPDKTVFETPEPDWQKFVIYYHSENNQIRRYETQDYEHYKESKGMKIISEPGNLVDPSKDRIIARNIELLSIIYSPSELNWNGGMKIIVRAYDKDIDFRTSLETTVGIRYAEIE